MITLYRFAPIWGLPDLSPFVTKLDVYLRMVELPYKIIRGNYLEAPKGKLPAIEDNGKKLGDSSLIIEYLKATHGDKLDNRLSSRDRATALGMQRLMEENLYWAGTIHERWVIHKEVALVQYARALGDPPPDLNPLREAILKQYQGQGMGRHSHEEVIHIAKTDLSALSAFLGERPYFMGEQPTSLDATAYGFLVHFLWAGYKSELNTYAKSLPNLQAYCTRMRERYYHAERFLRW